MGGLEYVILVDANDHELGSAEKLAAHRDARLHRAVSVMLIDRRGKVLLQRRAAHKYHSAGCWSNTVCGHPGPGEMPASAARRRLREEMGVDCPVVQVGVATYHLAVADGLTEHEIDHIFIGFWEGVPRPDPAEVSAWAWCSAREVETSLRAEPAAFTAWMPFVWEQVRAHAHEARSGIQSQ